MHILTHYPNKCTCMIVYVVYKYSTPVGKSLCMHVYANSIEIPF